ncbi:hypothetical protein BC940DRAFT_307363 [Gongronella butleri]|nr:hypothetical protein BC940DRAFT_307363 [Gongronella butleri]
MSGTASCTGCSSPILDGSVIAFGDSLFHLKCFVCTKCQQPVDCDANLLLLTDGRPVCENCSYICKACNKIIQDEAVMTGDEVYHADCFRCSSCQSKIEDLVFTQTTKGIYCTPCYEQRRAEKSKRREQRRQQRKASADSPAMTTRGSSLDTLATPQSPTPISVPPGIEKDVPALNKYRISQIDFADLSSISFFENDSVDLLNLTSSLGANLLLKDGTPDEDANGTLMASLPAAPTLDITASPSIQQSAQPTPTSSTLTVKEDSLNRASDMLRYSLGFLDFPSPPSEQDDEDDQRKSRQQLQNDLRDAKSQLIEMEKNLNKVKEASQQALDEFNKAKEEFSKEAMVRKQHEMTIQQLKHQLVVIQQMYARKGYSVPIDPTEIQQKAQLRADFDRYCRDMRVYRDRVARDINAFVQQKQAALENSDLTSHLRDQQGSVLVELQMLKKERDALVTETNGLVKTRDEVLTEMVMLNSKNAELSEMNNDLSRRMTEREREAAAILASTSFVGERQSSEQTDLMADVVQKGVASRDSYNGILAPKLFKIKKVNNMFSKLNTVGNHANHRKELMSPGALTSPTANTLYGGDYMNASTVSFANKQSLDGSHAFLPMPFTTKAAKCDGCHDRIKKGTTELKCQTCGMVAHTRCLGRVAAGCQGNETGKIIGQDLSMLCQLEQTTIPYIVKACIESVEARGMDYEGIYRKSGGAAQMRLIQVAFERGEIDLTDDDTYHDIGAVTSIFKSFLRELPDPLLTYDLYYQWVDVIGLPEGSNKLETVCELLLRLPKAHYDTLAALMFHLDRIQLHNEENRMTIKNLALVFGPTLMRSQDSSRDLMDMGVKNAVVEYLISHVYELF